MQVTNVYLPQGIPRLGLKPIKMERLGKTVVLAGKNGAGKTRFFNCLRDYSSAHFSPNGTAFGVHHAWNQIKNENIVAKIISEKPVLEKTWWLDNNILEAFLRQQFHTPPHNIPGMMKAFSELYLLEFNTDQLPIFVNFVPKNVTLADPRQWSSHQTQEQAKMAESLGINNLSGGVPGLIQTVQNRWWNAIHPHSTSPLIDRTNAIERYEKLCKTIGRFLNTELTRSLDGDAELFGRPIAEAKMSEGQIILLQFCIAVFAQAERLANVIVLMDEPENHLHPDAMLKSISEIQKGLTDGQIWIATHSIPLLAHFDPDNIWWVEDSSIRHAGSQPEVVLRGLVGDDEGVEKLADFLGLPASLAANNFAYQCLLAPSVIGGSEGDPQTLQIQRLVKDYRPEELLRIFDFGAGRGRLISAIQDSNPDKDLIKKRIDYIAYDSSSQHKPECEVAIERLYGSAVGRYLNDERSLRAKVNSHSVDILVMCNVLHEIEPAEWLPLFAAQGIIRWLLSPNGFLLIVEDTEMRIGEKAHQKGFVVLDTADIKTLFNIQEGQQGFTVDDARNDGRLKAHLIPASCLQNISPNTLSETLQQVGHLAKIEIKRLRQNEPSYREGRKHAYYVQQFANAELALESLRR